MLPSKRALAALAVVGLATFLAGCPAAKPGPSPADYAAQSLASAQQRIRGRWTLVGYAPEIALEPVLQVLVQSQIGRLTVAFDGASLVAEGPGLRVARKYQIVEANGDQLKVDVVDETGVPTRSSGTFEGDLLRFNVIDAPWRGMGTLKRTGS